MNLSVNQNRAKLQKRVGTGSKGEAKEKRRIGKPASNVTSMLSIMMELMLDGWETEVLVDM